MIMRYLTTLAVALLVSQVSFGASWGRSGGVSDYEYEFRATKTGDQSISSGITTLLTWETAEFDVGSGFDLANEYYVAPTAGKYMFTAKIKTSAIASGKTIYLYIYTNGVSTAETRWITATGQAVFLELNRTLDLAAGDQVAVYFHQDSGVSEDVDSSTVVTYFEGHYIGKSRYANSTQTPLQSTVDGATYGITNLGTVAMDTGVSLENPYGFRAVKTNAQTIANTTITKLTWDVEQWDVGSGFNLSSNAFYPPINGKYYIKAQSGVGDLASGDNCQLYIYTNGVVMGRSVVAPPADFPIFPVSVIANLTTSDYVEIYIRHNYGSNRDTRSTADYNWFEAFYIGE